jgi:hypothetical protein
MELILESSDKIRFHTDLQIIIEPFMNTFKELYWTLFDYEYMILEQNIEDGFKDLKPGLDYLQFNGQRLYEIVSKVNIQFNWGVFIGTKELLKVDSIQNLPFVDGNEDIWNKPNTFLNQFSEIEIISFDSSSTIVKFRDLELAKKWQSVFKEAKMIKEIR